MTRLNLSTTLRQQAASFGVAAVMTLAVLGGISQIADHRHADALMAQAEAQPAQQVVVIVGKRSTQS
ncbi:hypothetical protein HLB44_03265 [Aquincola sp. S2]|uniref:Uncharacterized protein n=1 Tax=Pseudaquabacterium terrae TaxID=2732868 RepID=A0ABX2EDC6_9BURK|nr:hypothetical protein [Aquabacterium terrae]NRF66002.1 hypothetical protein [Aquabacterium terrae]